MYIHCTVCTYSTIYTCTCRSNSGLLILTVQLASILVVCLFICIYMYMFCLLFFFSSSCTVDLDVVNYYLVCNETCQPSPFTEVCTFMSSLSYPPSLSLFSLPHPSPTPPSLSPSPSPSLSLSLSTVCDDCQYYIYYNQCH